ncbi:MAG: EAL domain-containing protein, partial [Pseudomonadota bacterium]
MALHLPGEDLARGYRNSQAFVAIVDARGALDIGLNEMRMLAQAVSRRRGGLLALLSRSDAAALPRVYEAGATHYLISPFGGEQLGTALRFVDRSIRRMRSSGTEAAMAEAQAQLAVSASWQWDRDDGSVELSPDLAQILGLAPNVRRMSAREALGMLPRAEMVRVGHELRAMLSASVAGEVEHELEVEGAERRIIHHVRPIVDDGGRATGLSATVEDLDAAAQQQRLSLHYDPLTGLASPTSLRARLNQALGGEHEHQPAAIAVLIGISRMGQVNAVHGRLIADALLQAVARRLRRTLTERDIDNAVAARLGGAEFAVAFFGPVMLSTAVFFSQTFAKVFERPFVIEGKVIHLACRIGIAASDTEMTRADDLLHRASSALATAKENDPNSFQVYFAGRADDPARLASLEQVVRDAAREGELDIRYQPQVDAVDGHVAGVEALVRYAHPVYGLLTAETLLATADRGEFGVEFGRHIIRQACREAAAWPDDMANVRLSVNVTSEDMRSPDFVRELVRIIDDTGFPAERLTLEITEGGLVENLERTATMLTGLRDRHIRIAISFVIQAIDEDHIVVRYKPTTDQLADSS